MRTTSLSMVLAALLAVSAHAETFTEAQARDRIEATGYTAVGGLRIDGQGLWHGQASRNGEPREVSLDAQGQLEDALEFAALTAFDPGTGEPSTAQAPSLLVQASHP